MTNTSEEAGFGREESANSIKKRGLQLRVQLQGM